MQTKPSRTIPEKNNLQTSVFPLIYGLGVNKKHFCMSQLKYFWGKQKYFPANKIWSDHPTNMSARQPHIVAYIPTWCALSIPIHGHAFRLYWTTKSMPMAMAMTKPNEKAKPRLSF